MNFRYMRMLLFFDLPRDTSKQRSQATKFVKSLIKEGFMMLQESVYCKLALNPITVTAAKERVKKLKPNEGSIMMLTVTEKQFSDMELILGEMVDRILNKTDRVVFF